MIENEILNELIKRYPSLEVCKESIYTAYLILEECFSSSHKLLIAGNGGSAADSEHIVGELMKGFCKKRAVSKDFFEKLRNQSNSNKITWSYRPMLSFTGHYAKAFSFDFDYTHIEATCTDGEMWNLEVEGQPRDTTMQFEKGKNVYWTPSDEIEKIPQKTEVTLKVYNNKTQLHKCTVIFECVSRDFSGAEFEIYLKDSDGLEMMYYDGRITFVKQSSISNVGGADNPNNIITEIVDRTVTERIPTDQAMQPFCADEKYI